MDFQDGVTAVVDKGRAKNIIHLVDDIVVLHHTLAQTWRDMDLYMDHSVDKNWLDGHTQRLVQCPSGEK